MNTAVKVPPSEDYIDFDDSALMRRYRKDLRHQATLMGREEAQYIVKQYYSFQSDRIRANNRMKAFAKNNTEPMHVLSFFFRQFESLEKLMIHPLETYVESSFVGSWLLSNKGIGPVLAAGLLAYLDVSRAPAATSFWRYAGIDPTIEWKKGQRRPYNAELKQHVFKVGKSFIMRGNDYYRPLFDQRKEYETAKNEAGEYAPQAFAILARMKSGKPSPEQSHTDDVPTDDDSIVTTVDNETVDDPAAFRKILESGRLSKAHINMRCQRWMTKLFLSHVHTVMFEDHFKRRAPQPYAIAHLNHVHNIPVPNYEYPYGN